MRSRNLPTSPRHVFSQLPHVLPQGALVVKDADGLPLMGSPSGWGQSPGPAPRVPAHGGPCFALPSLA